MNIHENVKIGIGSPGNNMLQVDSFTSDGAQNVLLLKNSNSDTLFQIDTLGRVGIQMSPYNTATVTLLQNAKILFRDQSNGNPSYITTDAAQGIYMRNTGGGSFGFKSDGDVAISGEYQDDLIIGALGFSNGKGTYIKAYNNTATQRTGLKYLSSGTGEPNLLLVPDFGAVGIGVNATSATLHVQGSGNTISTKVFKVDNNNPTELFSIYSSGQISAGDGNIGLFMGVGSSLNLSPGVFYNTAFGSNSMSAIVTGNYNSAFGMGSLQSLNGGDRNTGIGFAALANLTTGFGNTAIGWASASTLTTASAVTAVGFSALGVNNIGGNTAVGYDAAGSNTSGGGITAIGGSANEFNINGSDNTTLGSNALRRNYIGSSNTALGSGAGQANYSDGSYNVYIGASTGYSNGLYNLAQGNDFNNTTDPLTIDMSVYNQFDGKLFVNDYVTIGSEVLKVTSISLPNVTFSRGQFGSTIVVHPDGDNIQGGRSRNTFIGTAAGSNSLSNDSIFIGYTAGQSENSDNKFIVANATATLINGTFASTPNNQYLRFNANVGINIDAPTNSFAFKGIISGYAGSERIEKQSGIQTINSTITTISTISTSSNEMIIIKGHIGGFKDDYTASYGATFFAVFRNTGGVISQISTSDIIEKYDFVGVPTTTVDISGTNININVTGVAATNINWVVTYEYSKVLTNA